MRIPPRGGRFVAALVEIAGFFFGPSAAEAQSGTTVVLYPEADATIANGQPNDNRGSLPWTEVGASGKTRVAVRFSQAEIAAAVGAGSLGAAKLEMVIIDNQGNWSRHGRPVEVHRLSAAWSETAVTWNCAVDADLSNNQRDCTPRWDGGFFEPVPSWTTLHENATFGPVEFDVTADVRAFLAGTPNHGWVIKEKEEAQNGAVTYGSRERGFDSQRPRLILAVIPGVPTPSPTASAPPATATPTGTQIPTPTFSNTPSATPSDTPTATDTPTPTPSDTPSETPTDTPSSTATFTETHTETPTETPSDSPTATPTDTATETSTVTGTPTATPSFTPSPTPTELPTRRRRWKRSASRRSSGRRWPRSTR